MPEEPPKPESPKPPEGGPSEPDFKAEAEKWKALSRQNEAAAKKAADELKGLREAGDASKSETEKLAARLEAQERKLADSEQRALRAEVASDKQLPPKLAKRLQGSTREELEADADELLESIKPAKGDGEDGSKGSANGRAPRTHPRERLVGGSNPSQEAEELDPRKLAAKIPRR
jgi:hypothetical protein